MTTPSRIQRSRAAAPRDIPILFSAPMIRSILAGRKTQTRRILKPQPQEDIGLWLAERDMKPARWSIGDRLWVRENHYLTDDGHNERVVYASDEDAVEAHFAALDRLGPQFPDEVLELHKKLRPSIHMPRWAARITLEVEAVRVERLQSLTETDAIAEGLTFDPQGGWSGDPTNNTLWHTTPVSAYTLLWMGINGCGSWNANLWVSATTFRRITP